MSQSHSPFTIPDQTPPQRPGGGQNTVAIVAIIAFTLLLMCGGVVGLGIYAVDRLADQMLDFGEADWDWNEEDADVAIEFALAQDESIRELVGEINDVRPNDELTYHDDADLEDYFYTVSGPAGEAIVVVDFDEENSERWFVRTELVQGNAIDSPRTPLQARNAPFDSEWSKLVYDVLSADEHALTQSLNLGTVLWITYDYERSWETEKETELYFDIRGDQASLSVIADFNDDNFTAIASIELVDAEGVRQQQVYSADSTANMDSNADMNGESEPAATTELAEPVEAAATADQ